MLQTFKRSDFPQEPLPPEVLQDESLQEPVGKLRDLKEAADTIPMSYASLRQFLIDNPELFPVKRYTRRGQAWRNRHRVRLLSDLEIIEIRKRKLYFVVGTRNNVKHNDPIKPQ